MLEIEMYQRKPFTVEVVRVTAENMEEAAEWCNGSVEHVENREKQSFVKVKVHRPQTIRQTQAFIGDYILYSGTGFKVYTPSAFEKSFEKPAGVEITYNPGATSGNATAFQESLHSPFQTQVIDGNG